LFSNLGADGGQYAPNCDLTWESFVLHNARKMTRYGAFIALCLV
jgi:hypothetical protein